MRSLPANISTSSFTHFFLTMYCWFCFRAWVSRHRAIHVSMWPVSRRPWRSKIWRSSSVRLASSKSKRNPVRQRLICTRTKRPASPRVHSSRLDSVPFRLLLLLVGLPPRVRLHHHQHLVHSRTQCCLHYVVRPFSTFGTDIDMNRQVLHSQLSVPDFCVCLDLSPHLSSFFNLCAFFFF